MNAVPSPCFPSSTPAFPASSSIIFPTVIREGKPSLFTLPDWGAVRTDPAVRRADPDQCGFADEPPRPDTWTYKKSATLIGDADLQGFNSRVCDHPKRTWTVYANRNFTTSGGFLVRPPSGRRILASHPPLMGRIEAVADGEPVPKRQKALKSYLTRETAHYPAELNWHLVATLGLDANGSRFGVPQIARCRGSIR